MRLSRERLSSSREGLGLSGDSDKHAGLKTRVADSAIIYLKQA